MWVIYNRYNLQVARTCHTKAEAEHLFKRYSSSWRAVMKMEKFELGNLDAWVTWKHLTKGPYD